MARVFVYEHLTATTGNPDPAESLSREGRAMRDAVAADFRAVPGVTVVEFPAVNSDDRASEFERSVRSCDFALIVAPEFDAILETLVRRVEGLGVPLLGPSSEAVRLTADKLALFRHWKDRGIPTPETALTSEWPVGNRSVVIKPRYGCGSMGIRVDSRIRPTDNPADLAQSFVPGVAASVSFLIGPNGPVPLAPVFQHVSRTSNFRYTGGELPLPPALADRAGTLAGRAVEGVPGLRGYVGVDLVLGEDGSRDAAIELNPRLTTSYVGLRRLAESNLAELWLDVVRGSRPGPVRWKPGRVRFTPDGIVEYSVL